jgi:hypothetical protein
VAPDSSGSCDTGGLQFGWLLLTTEPLVKSDGQTAGLNRGDGAQGRRVGSLDRRVGSLDRPVGSLGRPVGSLDRPVGSLNRPVVTTNEAHQRGHIIHVRVRHASKKACR